MLRTGPGRDASEPGPLPALPPSAPVARRDQRQTRRSRSGSELASSPSAVPPARGHPVLLTPQPGLHRERTGSTPCGRGPRARLSSATRGGPSPPHPLPAPGRASEEAGLPGPCRSPSLLSVRRHPGHPWAPGVLERPGEKLEGSVLGLRQAALGLDMHTPDAGTLGLHAGRPPGLLRASRDEGRPSSLLRTGSRNVSDRMRLTSNPGEPLQPGRPGYPVSPWKRKADGPSGLSLWPTRPSQESPATMLV